MTRFPKQWCTVAILDTSLGAPFRWYHRPLGNTHWPEQCCFEERPGCAALRQRSDQNGTSSPDSWVLLEKARPEHTYYSSLWKKPFLSKWPASCHLMPFHKMQPKLCRVTGDPDPAMHWNLGDFSEVGGISPILQVGKPRQNEMQ